MRKTRLRSRLRPWMEIMYNHGACSGQAGRRIPRVRGWEGLYCAGHGRWLDHPARARVVNWRRTRGTRRTHSSRACAGGNATAFAPTAPDPIIPRVRGWEEDSHTPASSAEFIPRVRGWEVLEQESIGAGAVHPARARVERTTFVGKPTCRRSSRACAGGKQVAVLAAASISFIPRVRGWEGREMDRSAG